MKKTYLLWFAFLAFLLLGCRNEDFVNQSANNRREEEFFRQATEKASKSRNDSNIVKSLKSYNTKTHFVTSMKDQRGLPVWEKMKPLYTTSFQNKSGDAEEVYSVPLIMNGWITSVLYVEVRDGQVQDIQSITNTDLRAIINNEAIDKKARESLLLNYLLYDSEIFGTDIFINIPTGLLGTEAGKNSVRSVEQSEEGGEVNSLAAVCVVWISNCTCGAGPCDHCNDDGMCVSNYECVGGVDGMPDGGGDTGGHGTPGDTGGGGGGGNEGGSGEEEDDCSLDNKPFYKIVPGCDDDGGSNEHGGIIDPCMSIKAKFANTKFKEKYDALDKPENFDLDREKAYIMRYPPAGVNIPPSYFQVDMPPCATGNEDAVMPSNNGGLAELMHTHTNSTCNGNYPVKVPSPVDIKYLLNTLLSQANQYTGSYANAYSITITSGGSYMLMYTGTTYPGSLNDNTVKQLKKDYTKIFQDLYTYKDNNPTQSDIEKLFTKFMKEKINKPGLEVYRVTPTSAVKIEYDPASPNSVKQTPCP